MPIADETQYLKWVLARNNIFNEIEKKHLELVELIEKYSKLETGHIINLKEFNPLEESKLLGGSSPKLIIEYAYSQSINERLEKLRPIDLRKDLKFYWISATRGIKINKLRGFHSIKQL